MTPRARRYAAFVFAGSAGFLVDAAVLAFLLEFQIAGRFTARLVAIATALTVTWTLNRHVTFGASSRHPAIEGVRYGTVGIAGSVINYAIYSAILLVFPTTYPLHALVVASLCAAIISYFGYAGLVFDRRQDGKPAHVRKAPRKVPRETNRPPLT